jgi:hypothetical protein
MRYFCGGNAEAIATQDFYFVEGLRSCQGLPLVPKAAAHLRCHMGKRPFLLFVFLLAALVPFRAFAQRASHSPSENLEMCILGFSECNSNKLTPQEREWVKQSNEDRNFEECLTGSLDCNKSKLNPQENVQILRSELDRNLQTCLDGYEGCRENLLTDSERHEVGQAARLRNLRNCIDGLADCDRAQLTPQEQKEVADALYDRNLQNCLDGVQCDQSKLDAIERAEVVRATQDRNVRDCANLSAKCDRAKSGLTETGDAAGAIGNDER